LTGNLALKDGDIIVVPEGAIPTAMVLGEVAKAGSLVITTETRLLDAHSLAGGLTAKADVRRESHIRSGTEQPTTLDLRPLLAGGAATRLDLNIPIQPGDTIVVPESQELVYVLGQVLKPDMYALKPQEQVLSALLKAGGPAPGGDLTKTVLVRRDPTGKATPTTLNLKKLMEKGDVALNVPLQPGDILFVPDKKSRRSPLQTVLSLGGLIALFTQ
jgi:protein involved in polysaccharide export with SLBB domain